MSVHGSSLMSPFGSDCCEDLGRDPLQGASIFCPLVTKHVSLTIHAFHLTTIRESYIRNSFFCDMVSVLFLFCCRHFLHFVCDLTISQAWLRHQSTRNWMRITMIPLDGRRNGNSSRNLFFCDKVSVLSPSLFTFRM
jgi:hypothetical protein